MSAVEWAAFGVACALALIALWVAEFDRSDS